MELMDTIVLDNKKWISKNNSGYQLMIELSIQTE